MSILQGWTASARAVLLVQQWHGSTLHHSDFPLSILTNVVLMQAMAETGNQTFLPAAALFSNR